MKYSSVQIGTIETRSVETRTSWVVATVALLTLAFSFGAPWVAVVASRPSRPISAAPARRLHWRVPTLLMFSGSGMAAGACMGGALYDWYGYYAPAFVSAIGANILNLGVVTILLVRQSSGPRRAFGMA